MKAIVTNKSNSDVSTSVGVIRIGKSIVIDVDANGIYDISSELRNLVESGRISLDITNDDANRLRDIEIQVRGQTETVKPLTIYVNPNGDDNNIGSMVSPVKTIQAAIDRVPKRVRHNVTIKIAAGHYAGAYLTNFNIDPLIESSAYLKLEGELQLATPATGTASGIATGWTQGSGITWSVLTDTTQSWTVDNLKGKLLELTSTGTLVPIAGNTATTITLSGAITGIPATPAYRILDWATIIDVPRYFPTNYTATSTTQIAGLMASNMQSLRDVGVAIEKVKFATPTFGIVLSACSGFAVRYCNFQSMSISAISMGIAGRTCEYLDFRYNSINTTSYAVRDWSNTSAGYATIRNCVATGGAVLSRNIGISQLEIMDCQVDGASVGIQLATGDTIVKYTKFINCPTGIAGFGSGYTYSSWTSAKAQIDTCMFTGCGNCIVATEGNMFDVKSGSSSSCTGVGITATIGAKVRINSAVSLTGTGGDVKVDGAVDTYVNLRAATPKHIKNSNYFTVVFEQ